MTDEITLIIELHVQGKVIDLKIPRLVTLEELKPIVRDAVSTLKITLSPNFELKLLNKSIHIDDHTVLSHYPLGNGEEFEVLEEK